MPYPKTQLIRSYKNEPNPKVKERLLLILKVKFDKVIPAYAADSLHRSRPWALYWLDRLSKERIGGLKDRSKSGRPAGIPEEIGYQIKKELLSSKEGWTTKQVEELIVEKSGGIKYHYTHTHTHAASSASGASSRRCQERFMSTLHPEGKRMTSKKGRRNTCG